MPTKRTAADTGLLPWERQKGESAQAFEAFSIYRDLGSERSQQAVAKQLGKSRQLLARWSAQWEWVERARAYDIDLDRQARLQNLKDAKDMRRRQTKTGVFMQKKALEALEKLMINGRTFIRDACLEHFGVPREIMGITESSNRATSEAAQYIYAQNVLMPRLRRREDAINQQLLPLFGDHLIWRYDDIVPRNQEFDKMKAIDGWNAGLITKDEARELLDMPAAQTGGDVYKTTFSDIFVRADEDPVAVSSSMANLQYGEEAPAEEIEVENAPEEEPGDIITIGGLGGKQRKSVSLRAVARSEDVAAREGITAFEIATSKYFREQARRIGEALGTTQKAGRTAFEHLKDYINETGQVDSAACFVRSPNSSNSNNVRNVNTDGSSNNNNAYNGNNGVRPALVEHRDQVDRHSGGRKQRPTHQRNEYPVQRRNAEDKHITPTPRSPHHTQRAPGLSRCLEGGLRGARPQTEFR